MSKDWFLIILSQVLAFGIMCLGAWVGMLLFNWVVSLFGWAFVLTFWQAFGVCALLIFVVGFFKSNFKKS